MEKIKPCPFCGKQEFLSVVKSLIIFATWVECNNCGCHGPTGDTEAKAIAAWNRREGGQDG